MRGGGGAPHTRGRTACERGGHRMRGGGRAHPMRTARAVEVAGGSGRIAAQHRFDVVLRGIAPLHDLLHGDDRERRKVGPRLEPLWEDMLRRGRAAARARGRCHAARGAQARVRLGQLHARRLARAHGRRRRLAAQAALRSPVRQAARARRRSGQRGRGAAACAPWAATSAAARAR